MDKEKYKVIQDIKQRMAKETPENRLTTFKERNIVNIYNKRIEQKKRRDSINNKK